MENECFNRLYDYFLTRLTNTNLGYDYRGRFEGIDDFYKRSKFLLSEFRGECTRNYIRNRADPEYVRHEFLSIKEKCRDAFVNEFNCDLDSFKLETFLSFHYEIFEGYPDRAEFIGIKLDIYRNVVSVLEGYLSELPSKPPSSLPDSESKRIRKKSRDLDFSLELEDKHFIEIHHELIHNNLIDPNTNIDNFIEAFRGRVPDEKIIWIADEYSLAFFIRQLNKNNCFRNKLNKGIWEIVANRFIKRRGEPILPEKIKHSSASNTSYKHITSIAEGICELINPDQFED